MEGGVDLGVGYVLRRFTCLLTVTHPCSKRPDRDCESDNLTIVSPILVLRFECLEFFSISFGVHREMLCLCICEADTMRCCLLLQVLLARLYIACW